jgi:protein-S-isoprenylcysteine O-methyltransferase Ste14
MAIDVLMVERWVRLVAIAAGVVVICLPLMRLWLSRKTKQGGSHGKRISWTRWPAVAILTILYIVIGILFWKPIPLEISQGLLTALIIVGSVFYFSGITLYLWGFQSLGSLFGVSTITGARLYQQHQIVEKGPYAFVRHPMYLGVILAAIGAFLVFRTWTMVFFTPSAFSVILRAHREEELFARELRASWADYSKRVPAWMPRFLQRKAEAGKQVCK